MGLLFFCKGILELILMFLSAQVIIWVFMLLLTKEKHHENFVYDLIQIITNPLFKFVGFFVPKKIILKEHIKLFTFGLFFAIYFSITFFIIPYECEKLNKTIAECKKIK